MNNPRYLDLIDDLLPSPFHEKHTAREFVVCYLSEAREGQTLDLCWDFLEEGTMRLDANRQEGEKQERVFSAKILFE